MLKVSESMASCDQDFKSNKVPVINVKNRNGYVSMPAPVHGLLTSDQSNASFNNSTSVDEAGSKGDIRNGPTVDRSVYDYCCQLINPTCDVDNSNNEDTTEANDEASGKAIESNDLDATVDSISNNKLDVRKQGHIVRKRKTKDLPALIPIVSENNIDKIFSIPKQDCSYNLVAEPETCPSGSWMDTNSTFREESTDFALDFTTTRNSLAQHDVVKPSTDSDVKELENHFAKGNPVDPNGSVDVELKNCRGQKARKSLVAQANCKDIGSEIDGNRLENTKPVSASLLSGKEGIKSPQTVKQVESNAGALTGMTIKVNVLENALGLSTQSFSQLDAKTFDRIVLSVFQHKGLGQARKSGIGARASAKFGSTSRHANKRVGSAFMADHLQSSKSPLIQQQLEIINSPLSSTHSSEAFVKKPGFLAKKTSARSSQAFRNFGGFATASESMDSDSRSSPNSFIQDSSKSSFIQKARKSSQTPWSYNVSLRCLGKGDGSDALSDVNSQSNASEDPAFQLDKVGETMLETDEKNYIQTRQSYKRKWDSFNGDDVSAGAILMLDKGTELIKEKKVKSDFLVPMSRPRHCREVNYHGIPSDMNNGNAPNASLSYVSGENCKVTSDITSYDPACLCCCLIPGIVNTTITKCEAIDSFDGKALGCSRKVTNFEMLRPSAGIPFKALCNDHRRKLKDHQCCPGCGLFCAQGNFFECKEENRQEVATGETLSGSKQITPGRLSSVHRFHKQCQVFSADNKCYCPHCFSESSQVEGVVYNNEPRPATFLIQTEIPKVNQISLDNGNSLKSSARFCMSRKESKNKSGSVCSESLNSIQSSQSGDFKLRNEVDFHGLLESFNGDCVKLKKIRPCPKSLCLACKSGDISKVLYILAEGVDPTVKPDDFSHPAIHLASKYDNQDIVDILLKAGVSPDSIDNELHTPLMVASQNGCLSIVELLLKAGCSVEARAHDGMTALHLAAKSGRKEILRILLDTRKIDINTQDDGGWTALIWATEHGHKDCIAFLLSMGANPNLKDNELNTALHWGAFTGNEDIIALFLDAGCFIDDVNDHGDTPMHIAARQDHFKCVEVLLWRNADISITNKARLTPLECCVEGKCKSAQHLAFVKRLPRRPKEKIIIRDISRGRESCPIMVVNSIDSEDAQPDFCYILGYVETSPINVNRLVNSLQVCNCTDNCSSSSSCSCCRSSVKRWYDENGRLSNDFNFLEPPLIFECNIMCSCRTTCLNRVVQLGTINNLQVFRTNGRGWGCRTLRDIAKGTFVCEYAGELITDEEANRREDDSYLFDLDFQDSETYCIDAARYGNVSRFINHLCEPNVIPVKVFVDHQDLRFPRICFFASKDIKAFDELGFDYGYKFWSIKWKYFTCTCGSQNCRYSKDTILKTIEEYNKSHMDEVDNE